ncbi:MAG: hypothetical protein R2706_15555 [Acidimicrobiales bacterium]
MLDPDSTKVLARRILASLIDLGIVGILSALVVKSTAITYSNIERDAAGKWLPTAQQFRETANLRFRDSLVRVQEFGDTIVIFGGLVFGSASCSSCCCWLSFLCCFLQLPDRPRVSA